MADVYPRFSQGVRLWKRNNVDLDLCFEGNDTKKPYTFHNMQDTSINKIRNCSDLREIVKAHAIELETEAGLVAGGFTLQQYLMKLLHHLSAVDLQ